MRRLLFCLLGACALHATASAHVLDQYLQVAQVALAPDVVRVELRLIPGALIADHIIRLIDFNGDGKILDTEEQAYAQRVWQDVALAVDGQLVPLALKGIQFPSRLEMSEGIGAIRLKFTAEVALGAAGAQQLSFRNDHQPDIGVYLANALVPASTAIKINKQERDELQHELRINFHATADATHGWLRWAGVFLLCFCLCLTLLLPLWKRLLQLRAL